MMKNIEDLEYGKFDESDVNEKSSIRVKILNPCSLPVSSWDTLTPTFNETSDVYVWSLNGNTVQTMTINYTDATKTILLSIVRS